MAKFDRSLLPESPDLHFERKLWDAGVKTVCGIDEAGRGALAGPVAAAAVILPMGAAHHDLCGVRDSKALLSHERKRLSEVISRNCVAAAVGLARPLEIDRFGILPATRLAASRALVSLTVQPEHLLLDHLFLPDVATPQTWLTKGDQRSLSIAAASILAKVARDAHMKRLDAHYPGYDFARHKGYGTAAHRAVLTERGPSPVHRFTFAPLRGQAATLSN